MDDKTKESNGQQYSTTESLKNTIDKNLENCTDLFSYGTLEEFKKVHNMLKAHPKFEEVHLSA